MNAVPLPADEQDRAAGRICPYDYRYSPTVFARAPDFVADTLYVVGGLYGNFAALTAVGDLAACEGAPPQIVFNGDFHWFDAEPEWFAAIERGVAPHRALRGNVETEIARETDIGAGCGCAYPESVAPEVVARSNQILSLLQMAVPRPARDRLRDLPMHGVAQVGGLRIGIVHGDATALAGWRFAQEALDDSRQQTLAWRYPQPGASRRVRVNSHLPRRVARFRVARRTADRHQQWRCRHAEFFRHAFRLDNTHRFDALAAPTAVWR